MTCKTTPSLFDAPNIHVPKQFPHHFLWNPSTCTEELQIGFSCLFKCFSSPSLGFVDPMCHNWLKDVERKIAGDLHI